LAISAEIADSTAVPPELIVHVNDHFVESGYLALKVDSDLKTLDRTTARTAVDQLQHGRSGLEMDSNLSAENLATFAGMIEDIVAFHEEIEQLERNMVGRQ
jgi:hypothetical protein